MEDNKQQTNTAEAEVKEETIAPTKDAAATTPEKKDEAPRAQGGRGAGDRRGRGARRGQGGRGKGGRRGGPQRGGERFKPEYEQKIIDLRRVARVVAGGRRFSFRVGVVIGNRKGEVGVGMGKGGDTTLAIEKAVKNARKHLVKVPMTKTSSIPYEVEAKYASAIVQIRPAPGKGIVAGSSIRSVLDLAGLTNVGAKVLSRSKNKLNNARVALKALKRLPAQPEKKEVKAAAK